MTKRATSKTTEGTIDNFGTGHNFKSIEERDKFISDEFRARRAIMRRISSPPAASSRLVAQHRAEQMLAAEWDSLLREVSGHELAAWDEAERAVNEHCDEVEGLAKRAARDKLAESLEGWTVDGRNYLERP